MGASMLLQQRLSGAVTDPMQKQMMYMMPIIFTVMFLNFPAGLVLYWLVQNIISMLVQWSLARKAHVSLETGKHIDTTARP
jgi:YidC/Oxa1 family membrane protein insertase